jgi:hypothetical protein
MSGFAGKGGSSGTTDRISGGLITTFADPNADAFSRLRVSNNHILLSSQQDFDTLPLIWDTKLIGGASIVYFPNEAATELIVHGDPGDKVIRQTKRYWLYRAGQGQQISMTFADAYQAAGIRKRMGYFDDYNGIFLETTEDDVAIVRRSYVSGSAVDTRIPQASWNIDPFNGSGVSGMTLDMTKAQILLIDLQWLGVGRVRVGFDIDGRIVYAHQFLHANTVPTVYMSTASLPARYEIEATSASSGGVLDHICTAVIREGGSEDEGILTAAHTGLGNTTSDTMQRSILSIRLRSSFNRAFLKPRTVALANIGTQVVQWHLVLNPVLSGSLVWTDGYGQASQQSTQLVYTGGSGHQISTGYVSGSDKDQIDVSFDSLLGVAADIDGISDILSLIVQSKVGTSEVEAALAYLELF